MKLTDLPAEIRNAVSPPLSPPVPLMAIDPGPESSAYCMWLPGEAPRCYYEANDDVRRQCGFGGYVAIEMIASYGMAVGREVFETCLWIGRFLEAADRGLSPTHLLYRRDIKLHLCGTARARDANVRQAVIDRFGPGKERAIGKKKSPGPLYGCSSHDWAALAVALTWLDTIAAAAAGKETR